LGSCNVLLGMFLWLKTLYRKRAVTWPFIFYTIIWTLSLLWRNHYEGIYKKHLFYRRNTKYRGFLY
ncbi:hypothetical protein F6X77_03095, partial [Enterococcus faecium]